jgi:dolichol kinase
MARLDSGPVLSPDKQPHLPLLPYPHLRHVPDAELPRTFLHLIWGTALGLAYWLVLPRIWVLVLTAAAIVELVALEWLRRRYLYRGRPRKPKTPAPGDIDKQLGLFARIYARVARPFLRPRERRGDWVAAVASLAGYFTVALLFTKPIAVVAILAASLGDPAARTVGMRVGSLHVRGPRAKKSVEGLSILAAVTFALALLAGLPLGAAIWGGVAAAAADISSCYEIAGVRIDDNLVVPVSVGVALWAWVAGAGLLGG